MCMQTWINGSSSLHKRRWREPWLAHCAIGSTGMMAFAAVPARYRLRYHGQKFQSNLQRIYARHHPVAHTDYPEMQRWPGLQLSVLFSYHATVKIKSRHDP